jgi:3-hydroxy-9,10-secoandrosta-1,3,5(10)-triene-9,17-dione monooxygenase
MVAGHQKPSTAEPAASETFDRAYATTIARTRALVPQLRERAARTEELRHLPPETEQDLHEAGLFRILQPKRVGGSEFDYVAMIDCADLLGQADASVGSACSSRGPRIWSGAAMPMS